MRPVPARGRQATDRLVALLIDATTAQHARGIGTVIGGILHELPSAASDQPIVVCGPGIEGRAGLRVRRIGLARTRGGRLVYQRLLLPLDLALLRRRGEAIDRVLLLDSYIPLVRPRRPVGYAAFVHDVLPLTQPAFWPPAKRRVKRSAFAALRRARPAIFVSSEYNAREVERVVGLPARVVRYGCGQLTDAEARDACAAPLPAPAPYLVYVGAIEPRKDLFTLLGAFEQVASSRDLELIIVGDGPGPYVAALKARIAGSPYARRVEIVSRASRATALELVSRASALLFPSLAEGFGLPVLEALALGTPVVASDIPAIRTWAGDAILYGPPQQPASWFEPICAAVDRSAEERRAGQALARGFRWQRCAEELLRF